MKQSPNQLSHRKQKSTLFFIVFLIFANFSFSQPSNDQCDNASIILIPQSNLALGIFLGRHVSIDSATREIGEQCADKISELGNCGKTVWYTFTIATTRNVAVVLKQQDSSIPQIFAGFAIYKVNNCDYNAGNVSGQLTPIGKFGASGNSCLQAGTYYIQVSAREKSRGILWTEINVAEPDEIIGNKWTNPNDLGIIKDLPILQNIDNFCLSIDSNEQKSILPPDFTKSYWLKLEFRENAIQNVLTIWTYGKQNKGHVAGYRIFKNSINADSVASKKPFTYFKLGEYTYALKESCKNPSAQETVYVQLIFLTEVQVSYIEARSEMQTTDAWNTPDTDFEINVKNGYNKSFERYLNCNGLLADHRCSTIPDSFVRDIPGTNYNDTFRYGAYIVVKSEDYGTLSISGTDVQQYSYTPIFYILYKGDIRKDCNLLEVQRSQNVRSADFCVEPATYTILVTRPNHYYKSAYIKIQIIQKAIPKNVVAYKHDQPGFLGNVKPSVKKFPVSEYVHINNIDTAIQVDTFIRTGRFTFREFYLEEDGVFDLGMFQNDAFNYYLFKGRFSTGSVELLPNENYIMGYHTGCQAYKAGYYSIVAFHDTAFTYNINRCELPKSQIGFFPRFVCAESPPNSTPNNAKAIFNNQDLLSGTAYKSDISFTYPFEFCIDCKSETNLQDRPVIGCSRKPSIYQKDSLFFYYTFYLGQNAEVELPSYYATLFLGNVRLNSSIILDSLNVIDPCNPIGGNVYCNLTGGEFYTMVIHNPAYLQQVYRRIIVTPHQKSGNDFAINSRDLGKIEIGKIYKSPYDVITCHTYFSATDPCPTNNFNEMRCSEPLLAQMSYLDTINKGRERERQNLWYTFTVDDASTVQINVNSKDFCRQRITVFRYVGDFNESFSQMLISGFDSSINGLTQVAENRNEWSGNCRQKTLSFSNIQCLENRYFVLIDGDYSPNASYQLEVTKTLSANVYYPGDNCSTPSKTSINMGGTYFPQTKNHCHAYGGSPFEEDMNPKLKSTWFELDITQIQKYDLGILFLGSIKINGFTIYAGSCGAMTKIVDLNDQYSYFNLSCMGTGKYYIQVITSHNNVGDIKFEVTVEEKPGAPCKPYDFQQPLSGFEIAGGCNNDTIWFNNQSTKGEDISYSWFINGQLFSQLVNPSITRPDARLQNKNTFILVVRNVITNTKDTTTVSFANDTTKYFVEIITPPSFNCLDTLQLKFKTNYPHKLNLFWEPSNRFSNPFGSKQEMARVTDEKIYLTAKSENCILKDTLRLRANKPSGFFGDDVLCNGINSLIYDISKFPFFFVNNVPPPNNKTFSITKPGKYALSYYYNGCSFNDTINISIGGDQTIEYFYHDSTFCHGDTITLKSPKTYKKYDWGNNHNLESLTISKNGNYLLTGEINACSKDIHTYTVKSKTPNTNFIKDTAICRNDWFHFINPYPKQTVLFKNPNVDSFQVAKNSTLELHLQDSFCVSKAKANIEMIELPNEFKKMSICFNDLDGIWLDAKGVATEKYNWLGLNSFEPLFWAESYNKYVAQRTYINGCTDTLSFDIINNCPVAVFIPNAFSPNADGINSVFKPFITGTFESYHLLIFNRWGEVVVNQANGTWDGTYLGKAVPAGVYSVLIQVKAKDKITQQYVQTLTIIL